MKFELLAPAGDFSKLKTALYFGADAVYVGGKQFSLRALAGNFTDEALAEAVGYTHRCGKKIYVTVNIFAKNGDLAAAERYFAFLESVGADAAIVSDPGLIFLAQNCAPRLPIHLSTQANTTNRLSAEFWAKTGVKRGSFPAGKSPRFTATSRNWSWRRLFTAPCAFRTAGGVFCPII